MGFFDKIKEQTKEFKGKVEDIVEGLQAKRRTADLLGDLGRFLYAERTGHAIAGADVEIERLVAELKTLEDGGIKVLPDH